MIAALSVAGYALQALQLVPQLIAAGMDITNHITTSTAALQDMHVNSRLPTDAEWDALKTTREALQAELHAGGTP